MPTGTRSPASDPESSWARQSIASTCETPRADRRLDRLPLRMADDDGDGEAVPSLAADGLDRRRADARLGGQQLEPLPRSPHDEIVAVSVDHGAVADDVVHDDQAAAT